MFFSCSGTHGLYSHSRGILLIIDAHLHLPCYDDTLLTLSDKKERLMDDLSKAGVSGAIVIADSELSSAIGTPQECVELFSDTDNIFIMGSISPLIDYENRLAQLDKYLTSGLIIACKLYPGHEAYYMDDPRLNNVFQLCIKHDVPLAVHTGWDEAQYNHPKYFAAIAQAHPELRLVICHLYWSDIDLCYDLTATYPNIYYDISSLAYEKEYFKKARDSLDRIAKINPERILFGTDYGMCSIQDHIDLVNSLDISTDSKNFIFCENAIRLYKLKQDR